MAVDAVVADLDGTIWDSRPWYANIISDNSKLTAAQAYEKLGTVHLPRLINSLPGIGRTGFRRLMESRISELRLYPTVAESLEELDRRGTLLAAATSLPGWVVEPMLEATGLNQRFTAVAHGSGPIRKPDPQVVDQLRHELGADPSSPVVIGDDERDAQMAARAQLPFIWAAYGYGERPNLPIHLEAHSFSEVLSL